MNIDGLKHHHDSGFLKSRLNFSRKRLIDGLFILKIFFRYDKEFLILLSNLILMAWLSRQNNNWKPPGLVQNRHNDSVKELLRRQERRQQTGSRHRSTLRRDVGGEYISGW